MLIKLVLIIVLRAVDGLFSRQYYDKLPSLIKAAALSHSLIVSSNSQICSIVSIQRLID